MHPLGILDSVTSVNTVVILKDSLSNEINLFDEFVKQNKREPFPSETVNFVVEKGARLIAPSVAQAAILVDERWADSNSLTLLNEGFILGKGGRGGFGAFMYVTNSELVTYRDYNMTYYSIPTGKKPVVISAENGETGGSAIIARRKIIVINNGIIASGGGGGGGSGAWLSGFAVNSGSIKKRPAYTSVYNNKIVDTTYGGNTGSGGAPLAEFKPNANTLDWMIYKHSNPLYKQLLQDMIKNRLPEPVVLNPVNITERGGSRWDNQKTIGNDDNSKYYIDYLKNNYKRYYTLADFNAAFNIIPSYNDIKSVTTFFTDFKTGLYTPASVPNATEGNRYVLAYEPKGKWTTHHYLPPDDFNSVRIGVLDYDDNTEFYLSDNYSYGEQYSIGFLGSNLSEGGRSGRKEGWHYYANSGYFVNGKVIMGNYTGSLMSSKEPTTATITESGKTGYVGIKRLFIGKVFESKMYDIMLNPFWHNDNGKLTRKNKEEDYASGGIGGKWGVDGGNGTLNKAFSSAYDARGWFKGPAFNDLFFDIPIDHNMEWHKAPPGVGGKAGKIYTGNVVIDSKSRGYLAGYLPSGEYKPNNIPDWLANRAENWNKQGDLLTK